MKIWMANSTGYAEQIHKLQEAEGLRLYNRLQLLGVPEQYAVDREPVLGYHSVEYLLRMINIASRSNLDCEWI